MEIKVTKKHTVTFSVEYFEGTEGGMDHHCFRDGIATLEEAIVALEAARARDTECEWIITATVITSITSS